MRTPSRSLLSSAAVLAVAASLASPVTASTASAASAASATDESQHVGFHSWDSTSQLAHGRRDGTKVDHGRISMVRATGQTSYIDPFGDGGPVSYDTATWTSPVVRPGFDLDELVASWNARTPDGTWVQVEMRGTTDAGTPSKWYVMGRWASDDPADGGALHRTSVPSQGDDVGYISIDTFVARAGRTLSDWQLRVTLNRPHGTSLTPTVSMVGAMASNLAVPATTSRPARSVAPRASTLDVPTYSQETHIGQYPQWDNGGEAWCSPTSTSMVSTYWGAGPSAAGHRLGRPAVRRPAGRPRGAQRLRLRLRRRGQLAVQHGVRRRPSASTSFVTRLRSLTEAEQFIKAGHPAGGVGVLREGRARRRRLRHQRPPDGDRRLRPRTATSSSTTRRRTWSRATTPYGRRTTASSSRTPGSRTPAASPTSSVRPATLFPDRTAEPNW